MLGQIKITTEIDKIKHDFPRFSIIAGPTGSGKKMLARYIAKSIGAQAIYCDISVAAVREVIATAYTQKEPMVYILPDTDRMSISAKNALLKVTEEPPRKAYFIMTLESTSNTLDTLVSRGTLFRMNPYKSTDLMIYLGSKMNIVDGYTDHILDVCVVPGDINTLIESIGPENLKEYFDYVNLVIENIGRAKGSNAFKIGAKLSFKVDDDLWDLVLFLRSVRALCVRKLEDTKDLLYANYINTTSNTLRELAIKGIHKQSTFDMWILSMREAWRKS